MSGQGLVIMLVGLIVVFTFLCLLVAVMSATSRVFIRYAHLLPDDPVAKPKSSNGGAGDNGALVAAIAGAIFSRRK